MRVQFTFAHSLHYLFKGQSPAECVQFTYAQTINAEYYKTVLMKLIRIHIPWKRHEHRRGNLKLQHDNARFILRLSPPIFGYKKHRNRSTPAIQPRFSTFSVGK